MSPRQGGGQQHRDRECEHIASMDRFAAARPICQPRLDQDAGRDRDREEAISVSLEEAAGVHAAKASATGLRPRRSEE